MATSTTCNHTNPKFNPRNRNGVKYRLQAFHDYQYIDQTFDTMVGLVAVYGPLLGITISHVKRLRKRSMGMAAHKYKHILITDVSPNK